MVRDATRAKHGLVGRAGAAGAACVTLAGCTALLGDFTSRSSSDAGSVALFVDGAAGDAAVAPDATTAVDATTGAAADGGGLLACTRWLYASPVVLEVLTSGSRRVSGAVGISSPATGRARVIAGKTESSAAFSIYTVDKGASAPRLTQIDAPAMPGGKLATLGRGGGGVASATAVVTYAEAPDGGTLGAFSAYVVPDTMSASGPLPPPFVVYTETPAFPVVDDIRVLTLGAGGDAGDAGGDAAGSTGAVFAAVAYPTSTSPPAHVLGVGVATPAAPAVLGTVTSAASAGDVSGPRLFRASGQVYVYETNDPSSPGLSVWWVGDDGQVPTPPPARAVSSGQPARIQAIDVSTAGGAADIAYEQDTMSGAYITSIVYRAGAVPYGNLSTWVSTDLPIVQTFGDVFTAPTGIPSGSVWSNDNLMLLGPGLVAGDDGGVTPGLNLLWFDATGAVRSTESGANALLGDRDDFSSVAASPADIAPDHARWDVAWVETKADDAGLYDTVLYDELDCQ